jgi:hypothetical protein
MTTTTAAPTTTVTRDGRVTHEGALIGTVVKRAQEGLGLTFSGVGAAREQWFAVDADGKELSPIGYRTRREAVRRLESNAQPLTVTDVKLNKPNGFGQTEPYLSATVSWEGFTAMVSRYASEAAWIVDCFFTPGSSMPVFSNGMGTRYTAGRVLKGEEGAAATAAVLAAGLSLTCDHDSED